MRLVIDMQGAQTASRFRGIGRFTMSLSKAVVEQRGAHEVFLVLNGAYTDTIEPIRAAFDGALSQEQIRVFEVAGPVGGHDCANDARRKAAEFMREAFIASLSPDVVLIPSLFEEFGGDAVTSVGALSCGVPTAVVLHDLIPLIYSDIYLNDPVMQRWYYNKLDHFRRADLLLSVSHSAGLEAVEHLSFPRSAVVNISESCDVSYRPLTLTEAQKFHLRNAYGIDGSFFMYTGGNDHRKNIAGLFEAFASLPSPIRSGTRLVMVGRELKEDHGRSEALAKKAGLQPHEVIFTGYVSDEDLVLLYNACTFFVFPSWHEGFGLPVLEAMACGRAIIAANASSLPEVVGREDALFAPRDNAAMAAKMMEVLTNATFRAELERHGPAQAKKFSWGASADRAWSALLALHEAKKPSTRAAGEVLRRPRLAYVSLLPPAGNGIASYSAELLPELARFYDIDVIVSQAEIEDPWVKANVPIRDTSWFRIHAQEFDRVLYQFEKMSYHEEIIDLIEQVPGVCVIHDFQSRHSRESHSNDQNQTLKSKAFLIEQGWSGLHKQFQKSEHDRFDLSYSLDIRIIQLSLGAIVTSQLIQQKALHWYGADSTDGMVEIPYVAYNQNPRIATEQYQAAIESFYAKAENKLPGAIKAIAHQHPALRRFDWPEIAKSLGRNFPFRPRKRQLFLDISELAQRDARTGIQRVTRALLREIALNPPDGWAVEPVYATADAEGFRYARRFMCKFLKIPDEWAEDEIVEVSPEDKFLGLDFQTQVINSQKEFLLDWRRHGVTIQFVVHDLLPVLIPEVFPEGTEPGHRQWLETISCFDGALCVSRSVADEFHDWLKSFGQNRERPYALHWFHHGADIDSSAPTRGLPLDAEHVLAHLRARPSFLMVGTIEPRKGYLQTIAAFERLWATGIDVNLVIVGAEGWKGMPDASRKAIPQIVRSLTSHSQSGKRLFWLESISDQYLEKIYAASTCLLAASEGEGFGLPLIEAARHGLPLLVRDIPVFREVTAGHAHFFPNDLQPAVIRAEVEKWLSLYRQGGHPKGDSMPYQTWKDSARQVLDVVLGKACPYRIWSFDSGRDVDDVVGAVLAK